MHLSTYRFHGDPESLAKGYRDVVASFPPEVIGLNLAVQIPDGLLVIDTCPTEADFDAFSTSPEFAAALAATGLPTPIIESVGTVVGATGTHLAVQA